MEENIENISLKEKEKIVIANKKKEKSKFFIISVISVVVFLIIWQLITDVFKLFPSYSLPSPYTVFKSFIYKLTNKAPDNGTLFQHILASLQVALTGYFLGAAIGIPLGICMAWFKKFNLVATPLFDTYYSMDTYDDIMVWNRIRSKISNSIYVCICTLCN